MGLTYGFYSAMLGDRKYDAVELSHIFDGIISEGVYPFYGEAMAVSPGTGLKILIGEGRAWFKSTWTLNDSDYELPIESPDGSYNRIDSVVLEMNFASDVRANQFKIVKGTPSSTPVEPTLETGPVVYQYRLANVLVRVGVSNFLVSDITNTVGTAETPYTLIAKNTNIEKSIQDQNDFLIFSPKSIADYTSGFGFFNLSEADNKIFYSNDNLWNPITQFGWVEINTEVTVFSNKILSAEWTTITKASVSTANHIYNLQLSVDLPLEYKYHPVILESNVGKKLCLALLLNNTTKVLRLSNVDAIYTTSTSNKNVRFLDLTPVLQINGDYTKILRAGTRLQFTQDGVIKHFIVIDSEKITTNGIVTTYLTIYRSINKSLNENVLLTNSEISDFCFSYDSFPVAFPNDKYDWTFEFIYPERGYTNVGGTDTIWYQRDLDTISYQENFVKGLKLVVPKGKWIFEVSSEVGMTGRSSGSVIGYCGLTTYPYTLTNFGTTISVPNQDTIVQLPIPTALDTLFKKYSLKKMVINTEDLIYSLAFKAGAITDANFEISSYEEGSFPPIMSFRTIYF